jgi:hypothetical protein
MIEIDPVPVFLHPIPSNQVWHATCAASKKHSLQVHQVHPLFAFISLGYELVVFDKFIKFIKFISSTQQLSNQHSVPVGLWQRSQCSHCSPNL